MSMEVNRQELKARARERLRASHPAFWKITLVYLLLTSGVTAVADLAGAARIGLPPLHLDTFALFLSLLVILYTTVMHLGTSGGPFGPTASSPPGMAPSLTASPWPAG